MVGTTIHDTRYIITISCLTIHNHCTERLVSDTHTLYAMVHMINYFYTELLPIDVYYNRLQQANPLITLLAHQLSNRKFVNCYITQLWNNYYNWIHVNCNILQNLPNNLFYSVLQHC